METDKRTKKLFEATKLALKDMLEQLLAEIGQEFNRGAVINAVAVAADTKSNDSNKIELRSSKRAGDITIPTQGIFISTNCIEAMRKSIDEAGQPEEEEPENGED